MKRQLFLCLQLFLAATLCAEEGTQQAYCVKSREFFAGPESSDYRKYARDREIDILHVAIDVTPDFTNRTASGTTLLIFKPIAKPFEELNLDAVNLSIGEVTSSEPLLGWHVTDDQVIVTFESPIPPDHEAWVKIQHSAEPQEGMYFRTPEMGYKPGDAHLFTQGEAVEARHWYPCFDAPNEKFTSEITCRVPEGMTVLANGRLVSRETDAATGLQVVKWSQEKPHVNYLIALVAGCFEKVEDSYRDIPLALYTLPSDIGEAQNSFQDTKDIMGFFEREIGVPFPWPKYFQVTVNDFVAGGMENTSLTILSDRTLFTEATENIRSSQSLVAHEMAHQWFGDLVTCKDWSHIWLNEGFATYYDALYDEHKNGRDSMLYGLYQSAQRIIDSRGEPRPIVDRVYSAPMDMFGYRAYQKGAWVLHMLRSQLGEELYRSCIKTYLERHQYGSVVTEDLNAVIEELSGRSYDQFFDQWVYHAHHPELDVKYNWDTRAKLAKISIRQTQKITNDVLLFNFPLTIRFKKGPDFMDRDIVVKEQEEDFYFPLEQAPEIVRVDPELALLARVNFNPPTAMLQAQLRDESDAMGRIIAVRGLSDKKDKTTVAKLKSALNRDNFYGVRIEAARALQKIHTDDSFEALASSTGQEDARVRQEVYAAVGNFFRPEALSRAEAGLAEEKNPDIQSSMLTSLGAYPGDEPKKELLDHLQSESYRNAVADAAIEGMRMRHDPSCIGPLMADLKSRKDAYTSRGFARALDTLALLARDEEDRDDVRNFVTGFVNDPREVLQTGAIRALGTLEDPRSRPILETFTNSPGWSPQRTAAERALRSINESRRSNTELGDLRDEVLKLKQANEKLQEDFEDLEKQFKATTKAEDSAGDRRGPRVLRSPRDRVNR